MKIAGIDPGANGSCVVHDNGVFTHQKFTTEGDMAQFIKEQAPDFCFLEEVHSMPGQGVSSVFSFGSNYGFYRGVLFALGIPFSTVPPAKWMRDMRCLTKGDKNISKRRAQELYPTVKMIHALADAYLICTYGVEVKKGSNPRPPSFRGANYFDDFLT